MKNFILLFFTAASFFGFSQENDYYEKKGFVAEGYDVVAYFDGTPIKGNKKFVSEYDGAKFSFSSNENLEKFNASPERFTPQYGGYCAYAVAAKGKKVGVNPETFEIRDGKLYLFYNSWGTNTLELWKEEGAAKLQIAADKKWEKIKGKS